MNLGISIYLDIDEGAKLDELVDDLSKVLIQHGYVNVREPGSETLRSLIGMHELVYDDPQVFFALELDKHSQTFIPIEREVDGEAG